MRNMNLYSSDTCTLDPYVARVIAAMDLCYEGAARNQVANEVWKLCSVAEPKRVPQGSCARIVCVVVLSIFGYGHLSNSVPTFEKRKSTSSCPPCRCILSQHPWHWQQVASYSTTFFFLRYLNLQQWSPSTSQCKTTCTPRAVPISVN